MTKDFRPSPVIRPSSLLNGDRIFDRREGGITDAFHAEDVLNALERAMFLAIDDNALGKDRADVRQARKRICICRINIDPALRRESPHDGDSPRCTAGCAWRACRCRRMRGPNGWLWGGIGRGGSDWRLDDNGMRSTPTARQQDEYYERPHHKPGHMLLELLLMFCRAIKSFGETTHASQYRCLIDHLT